MELNVPKLRKGSYPLGFLEPRRTTERAVASRSFRKPLSTTASQPARWTSWSRPCA